MKILKITETEINELSELSTQIYNQSFKYLWKDENSEWYCNKTYSSQQLKAQFEDLNSAFYFILNEEKKIGYFKIKFDQAFQGQNNVFELERIYIDNSETNKGNGQKILEFIEKLAFDKQIKLIMIKAMDSSLDAIAFYQKNGYQISGNLKLDFNNLKDEYKGMVILTKKI